jgi:hypothetical protein
VRKFWSLPRSIAAGEQESIARANSAAAGKFAEEIQEKIS